MPRKSKRRSRKEGYTREMIRAAAVLAVAVAAFFASSNENIMNRVKKALGLDEILESSDGSAQIDDAGLTVEFIDVGQGDCTLISSGGEYMLIDTGDRDSSNRVIEHLEELGVEKLDYFVLSHPHADHIGEAAEIIEGFEIGDIIMPEVPEDILPDSMTYDSLVETAEEKGEELKSAPDKSFGLGECSVQIYAPDPGGKVTDNLNNYSLIVRLTHGENVFLFTGDCELEEESQLLARGIDLSADVLKAGHHGSYTSSSDEWLEEISPSYAVISCGAENQYGHPHEDTLERLEDICKQVYITAESGSVTFRSDGKNLSVETELDDYNIDTAS